jgi:hypothetical protein
MKKQMKFKMELLILPIVLLFIYFRPTFLVNFSSTFLGKLLMLGLIVLATLKNKWYGVSAAVLSIIITEMGMIEGMDDMGGDDMGGDDMGGDDMGGDDMGGDDMDDMDMDEKAIMASMDEMNGDEGGGADADDMDASDEMMDSEDTSTNDMVSDDAVEETGGEDMSGDQEPFSLINNFGITGGNERLYMDEKLRAKSSNDCLY